MINFWSSWFSGIGVFWWKSLKIKKKKFSQFESWAHINKFSWFLIFRRRHWHRCPYSNLRVVGDYCSELADWHSANDQWEFTLKLVLQNHVDDIVDFDDGRFEGRNRIERNSEFEMDLLFRTTLHLHTLERVRHNQLAVFVLVFGAMLFWEQMGVFRGGREVMVLEKFGLSRVDGLLGVILD